MPKIWKSLNSWMSCQDWWWRSTHSRLSRDFGLRQRWGAISSVEGLLNFKIIYLKSTIDIQSICKLKTQINRFSGTKIIKNHYLPFKWMLQQALLHLWHLSEIKLHDCLSVRFDSYILFINKATTYKNTYKAIFIQVKLHCSHSHPIWR